MNEYLKQMVEMGLAENPRLTKQHLAFIETADHPLKVIDIAGNNPIASVVILLGQEWEDFIRWTPLLWAGLFNWDANN